MPNSNRFGIHSIKTWIVTMQGKEENVIDELAKHNEEHLLTSAQSASDAGGMC